MTKYGFEGSFPYGRTKKRNDSYHVLDLLPQVGLLGVLEEQKVVVLGSHILLQVFLFIRSKQVIKISYFKMRVDLTMHAPGLLELALHFLQNFLEFLLKE